MLALKKHVPLEIPHNCLLKLHILLSLHDWLHHHKGEGKNPKPQTHKTT
jgi:hypothetical protein